jgi:hypothetical protein
MCCVYCQCCSTAAALLWLLLALLLHRHLGTSTSSVATFLHWAPTQHLPHPWRVAGNTIGKRYARTDLIGTNTIYHAHLLFTELCYLAPCRQHHRQALRAH